MYSKNKNKKKRILTGFAVLLFWLVVWFATAALIGNSFLFPSPTAVLKELKALLCQKSFLLDCGYTVSRIFSGCLLGTVIGLFLGALTSFSYAADKILTPLLTLVKATPVASFIILLLVFFSRNGVVVLVAMLISVAPVWSNTSQGLKDTDPKLVEMAKVFSMPKIKALWHIYFYSAKNAVFSGIITAMGLAWKAGVSAEIIALPAKAIGSDLFYSKSNLDYTRVFAQTLVIIAMSLILEESVKYLMTKRKQKNGN